MAGNTIPAAGNTVPMAGNTIPVAGNTVPVAGNTVPVAGNTIPMAGNSIPSTGMTFPPARNLCTGGYHPASRSTSKAAPLRICPLHPSVAIFSATLLPINHPTRAPPRRR
jgi:hypothetical protein